MKTTRLTTDQFLKQAPKSNTIYEYYGDFWHGNPTKNHPNETNKATGISFGELYKQTLKREMAIIESGFLLKTIWESDYVHSTT